MWDVPRLDDIRDTWDILARSGHPVEVRMLRRTGSPAIGRFTRVEDFVRVIRLANDRPEVSGIYCTVNPLRPDAPWTRPLNRIFLGGSAAKDGDVAYRRWLLVDLDPIRPPKTNATVSERQAAFTKARTVGLALRTEAGWPDPVQATSGNGAHLLYPLADWPNDPEHTALVQHLLQALASRFSDAQVDVDLSVFNASRISKVYGTVPKKGQPTSERPWWPALIVHRPAHFDRLTPDAARQLFLTLPLPPPSPLPSRPRPFVGTPSATQWNATVERMQNHLIQMGLTLISDPIPYPANGWNMKILIECPWAAEHTSGASRTESAILWSADGRIGYKCQHQHCVGRQWKDVKLWATGAHFREDGDNRWKSH